MVRLGIEQNPFIIFLALERMLAFNGDLETIHHGEIIEPPDFVRVTNGHRGYPVTEQPLDRHGTSYGIRIGIDENKHLILALKKGEKAAESVFC